MTVNSHWFRHRVVARFDPALPASEPERWIALVTCMNAAVMMFHVKRRADRAVRLLNEGVGSGSPVRWRRLGGDDG